MKYLPIIAIILSILTFAYSYQSKHELLLGSTVTSTASSDTLETLRVNVNASLASLQSDKVSTTTSYTWTAFQTFAANASSSVISANYGSFGGTATTTLSSSGLGVASTSPFGIFSVEQGTETDSVWIANNGSSTASFVVKGVNGNGKVGIASSSPFTQFGVGTAGATSTISLGYFCAYAQDEQGRNLWIKLSTSGNTVFSTSTTPCNIKQ